MNKETYFLITNTPLHAGGSEQIDIIDLPIQRERHTRFPKIEGSSLKGAIRAAYTARTKDNSDVEVLFGGEGDSSKDKAASLGFSDARILAFPVKSVKGVFAWVTCPTILQRFMRDTGQLTDVEIKENTVPKKSKLVIKTSNPKIILEEFAFDIAEDEGTTKIAEEIASTVYRDEPYWKKKFSTDLVILDDDSFQNFVENSTEIVTRIRIDHSTKTVQDTGLFNEEFLPEDTIMYFLLFVSPPPQYGLSEKAVMDKYNSVSLTYFQLGADSTLGKGYLKMVKGETEEAS